MKLLLSFPVWALTALSILVWLPSPVVPISAAGLFVIRCLAVVHLSAMALVLYFRFVNPQRTAFMRHFAHRFSADGYHPAPIAHHWVPLHCISKSMQLAVIAGEDPLFPRHYGFDWESIHSAMTYNRTAERKRGASGITQQLAKNLFLWSAASMLRKLIEAYLTLLIEAAWSKARILEVYLNIAQFGRTLFGVEAAAAFYFSQPAADLQERQAALLAAILPNPMQEFSPDSPSHHIKYRQVMILRSMKLLRMEYLETL